MDSVGVIVLRMDGSEVARARGENVNLGLYEGTGVYDVTGEGWPEIVLVGQGGAKTFEAKIYRLQDHRLKEIFEWSGWHFRVVQLSGRPVVALTQLAYGSLSRLYLWDGNRFAEASDRFPEFFTPEIREQQALLSSHESMPISLTMRACQMGARAMLYGRRYDEARDLCLKALKIAHTDPRLTSQSSGASPQELQDERRRAEQGIGKVLEDIAQARTKGSTQMPEEGRP